MLHLTNAFSLNMFSANAEHCTLDFVKLSIADVNKRLDEGFCSGIGHADTAAVIGNLLGRTIPCNRATIVLEDALIVAQYVGPRLPEGATKLPEGATITFWLVRFHPID
jgi:hypothetical protein